MSKWDYRICTQCVSKVKNEKTFGCHPLFGIRCEPCLRKAYEKIRAKKIPKPLGTESKNSKFCLICDRFIAGKSYMYILRIANYYYPFCKNCKGYHKTDRKLKSMASLKVIKDNNG